MWFWAVFKTTRLHWKVMAFNILLQSRHFSPTLISVIRVFIVNKEIKMIEKVRQYFTSVKEWPHHRSPQILQAFYLNCGSVGLQNGICSQTGLDHAVLTIQIFVLVTMYSTVDTMNLCTLVIYRFAFIMIGWVI